MRKFRKSTWMNGPRLALAKVILTNYVASLNPNERLAAAEGLACLEYAKPEYLMNLIPQDHPDRIAAMRILTEE